MFLEGIRSRWGFFDEKADIFPMNTCQYTYLGGCRSCSLRFQLMSSSIDKAPLEHVKHLGQSNGAANAKAGYGRNEETKHRALLLSWEIFPIVGWYQKKAVRVNRESTIILNAELESFKGSGGTECGWGIGAAN